MNIFLQELLSFFIDTALDWSKDHISQIYKEMTPKNTSYDTLLYSAFLNSFGQYCGINLEKASFSTLEYFFDITEQYGKLSQQTETPYIALIQILEKLDKKYKKSKMSNLSSTEKTDLFTKILLSNISNNIDLAQQYLIHTNYKMNSLIEEIKLILNKEFVFINQNIGILTSEEYPSMYSQRANEIKNHQNNISTKQKYITKWNSRLFLHKRNQDKNLTLSNTYIYPLYRNIFPNLDSKPKDNLEKFLNDFFLNGKSMLIIGSPGIGKSSLICNLANKYKENSSVIILRFSEWDERDWIRLSENIYDSLLFNAIISKLNCSENDLIDKTIIIDGFDEIKYCPSDHFFNHFLLTIRRIKGLRVLITCRENYIDINSSNFQKVIKLCPFNDSKILSFSKLICDTNIDISFIDDSLKSIYGIPIILYLILSTNIDFTNDINITLIYQKVFSIEGGIFDRFSTDYIDGYEDGTTHTLSYLKNKFYTILCRTAYTMYKSSSNNHSILYSKYIDIIKDELIDISTINCWWYDFPIDNLYEKGNYIEFVHNSIYEYFASEYIYKYIKQILCDLKSTKNIAKAAKDLCTLICYNEMSSYMIDNIESRFQNSEYSSEVYFNLCRELLFIILEKGSIYYLKNEFHYLIDKHHKHIFEIEKTVFCNLMHIIHFWDIRNFANDDFVKKNFLDRVIKYMQINMLNCTIDLSSINFNYSQYETKQYTSLSLKKVKFNNAIFSSINIFYSQFSNCKFDYVTLSDVSVSNCEFNNIISKNINQKNVIFLNCQLEEIYLYNSNFTNVFFIDTIFGHSELDFSKLCNNIKFLNCTFICTTVSGNLDNACFRNSCFNSSSLIASFIDADFQGTKLKNNTILTNGIFTGASFCDADITEAIYDTELFDVKLN